ncbi:hypothetical protein AQUCO_01700075v1 [Aquilegia coerulea]|uniref:Uncharacterized protein n=1 Tax=Aquilegia coerulea TaxID=218851 RepID=A0A2G5DLS8_AQUCA|nr:hypothetical protein AQUCO_01700075v1 [Aquilegia coerulea]
MLLPFHPIQKSKQSIHTKFNQVNKDFMYVIDRIKCPKPIYMSISITEIIPKNTTEMKKRLLNCNNNNNNNQRFIVS